MKKSLVVAVGLTLSYNALSAQQMPRGTGVTQAVQAKKTSADVKKSALDVRNTSYSVYGERILRQEIVVPVGVQRVWQAFTTTEGLRTWAAPVVEFELKTGGKFHSNYQPSAKVGEPGSIYNTVLSYIPLKMLAFKIGLTKAFAEGPRQEGSLFAVAEFEQIGKTQTKVVLSMAGWGAGKDWDTVYAFFERNNPTALLNLRDSLVTGPIHWQKQEQ